jgi:hypothetical protein
VDGIEDRSFFVRFHPERELGAAKVASEIDGFLRPLVEPRILKRRAPVGVGREGRHVFERKIAREQIGVADGAITFGAREGLFGCAVSAGWSSRRVRE